MVGVEMTLATGPDAAAVGRAVLTPTVLEATGVPGDAGLQVTDTRGPGRLGLAAPSRSGRRRPNTLNRPTCNIQARTEARVVRVI